MLKHEFSIDHQEDEDLRCPICNFYFSNITKPYLLPCNHNLCIKCIDSIINKKMYNCPICRKSFNDEDRKNFQVNFAFLNLVIKILKTKVIFCKKCSKIFNWMEHYSECDEKEFKETNEIMDEIKKLADDCLMILKYADKHKNILQKSKNSIFENTNEMIKILNLKFYEHFQKTMEQFFQNIPDLNVENFTRDLINFLDICKPFSNAYIVGKAYNTDERSYDSASNIYFDDTNIGYKGGKNKMTVGNYSSNFVKFNPDNLFPRQLTSFKKGGHMTTASDFINRRYETSSKYLNKGNVSPFKSEINCAKNIYNNNNNSYIFQKLKKQNSNDQLNKTADSIKNVNNLNICQILLQQQKYKNNMNDIKNNNENYPQNENEDEIENEIENENNYDNDHEEEHENEIIDLNLDSENSEGENEINLNKNMLVKPKGDTNPQIHQINSYPQPIINFQKKNKEKLYSFEINNTKNNSKCSNVNGIIPLSTNTNILNFNYNFNITELIEDNLNFSISSISEKDPNNTNNATKNKQKIVVRNDKIEIVNVGNRNLKNKNKIENNNEQVANEIIKENNSNINFKHNFNSPNLKSKFNLKNEIIKNNNINNNNNIITYNSNNNITNSQISFSNSNHRNSDNSNLMTKSDNLITKIMKQPETPNQNQHDSINKMLSIFNKTKETVQKILNYTQQIEFMSETIKIQISTNYNNLNENILNKMTSLCDNITVSFKNYPKRYLINLIENSKKIWVFDSKKMKSEIKEFPILNFKINSSSSVEYDDNDLIFLTGGRYSNSIFDSDTNYSSVFFILRWSNKNMEFNGHMPHKRAFHSTIFFENKLYVIGGVANTINSNVMTNIKDCECYNLLDKRWELMPSLNSGRSNPSLCVYNNSYLYAFRGWAYNKEEYNYLDTIEFLNIKNVDNGWILVKPEDPGMSWINCTNSAATVIGENKILICGGCHSPNKNFNFTFVYDPLKKIVFRSKDLLKSASFNSLGTVQDNNVIIIDQKNETNKPFGVHIYDLENKIWKFNQI